VAWQIHRNGAPTKLSRRVYHLPHFDSQVYVLKSSSTHSYQPASKLHKDSNPSLMGSTRDKEKGREHINWQKQAELDALPTFTTYSTVTVGTPKKPRKKDKPSTATAVDLSASQTSSRTSYTPQFNILGRRSSHDELRNPSEATTFMPRIDVKGKGKEREAKKKDWKLRWMAIMEDRLVVWKEYYVRVLVTLHTIYRLTPLANLIRTTRIRQCIVWTILRLFGVRNHHALHHTPITQT
jgi:hypothetical protein